MLFVCPKTTTLQHYYSTFYSVFIICFSALSLLPLLLLLQPKHHILVSATSSSSSSQQQQQQQQQLSTDNVLIIRHGRSRVRHSTEKDHLRWGLKAFDNLTLEYEDDFLENNTTQIDGIYGTNITSFDGINNGTFYSTSIQHANNNDGIGSSSSSDSLNYDNHGECLLLWILFYLC